MHRKIDYSLSERPQFSHYNWWWIDGVPGTVSGLQVRIDGVPGTVSGLQVRIDGVPGTVSG